MLGRIFAIQFMLLQHQKIDATPRIRSVSTGRNLLNVGECNRVNQPYGPNDSPFLSSSLSFEPNDAGAQTEVLVVFTMAHEICRGDRVFIKLSNFSFVPPQGSELDPGSSFLETKSDSTYSKYIAAFDQITFQLTLTYIDFLPVSNFQRQIVSIPSKNSLRLPPVGVPNNDTIHFSIAFAQGAPSNIISEAYPFTITQPAVRILFFSMKFASADMLSDLLQRFAPPVLDYDAYADAAAASFSKTLSAVEKSVMTGDLSQDEVYTCV
jgi:hypothetical protein